MPVTELYAAGGIAEKNAMMMQIYADVTNMEIRISASPQAPAYGSSMFGAGSQSAVDSLSEDAVGVITIDGTIDYDGSTASPEGLKAQLDRAENNPHIKAVVLRVNSGGGTATAGEEMACYVNDFRSRLWFRALR